MVPVLMLGMLVAIVKFSGFATIEPGPGIWAFAILTFLLTALSRLTAHRLWRHAEDAGLVASVSEHVSAGALVRSEERGEGKGGAVRVDLGGRRISQKKNKQ